VTGTPVGDATVMDERRRRDELMTLARLLCHASTTPDEWPIHCRVTRDI
jgi:hypothetical protein